MLELVFNIAGTEVTPENADSIGISLDWTGDVLNAELTSETIVLANEAKKLVLDSKDQYGVTQGIPMTITVGSLVLEYQIDLTQEPKFSGEGDSFIEVSILRRRSLQWFVEEMKGLSFEVVNNRNPIDTFNIPYIIVKDNQIELLITLAISTYQLTKALVEGIRDLVEAIAEITQASTPNTGVPPSVDTGDIIAAVAKGIARTAYVLALSIALISLTKRIMELLFPLVRNFKGSFVFELLKKACLSVGDGFEFKSSILEGEYSNLTILPVPLIRKSKSIFTNFFDNGAYNLGYPTSKDGVIYRAYGLLNEIKKLVNGQIRIIGNTVYLERRDYWVNVSPKTVTTTLNLQDERENQYTIDSAAIWRRYFMSFVTDSLDTHTLDNIEGTDCEYLTEQISITDKDLINLRGVVNINLPLALGVRKNELNIIEKAAEPFAKLGDKVIQFFGGEPQLQQLITGRIGVLQISQQYFKDPKLMFTTGGKQPNNYLERISANTFYQKFHTINEVSVNLKRIYDNEVQLSESDMEAILDNNYLIDQNANSLELRTLEWSNGDASALISYKINKGDGFNTETIAINT